MLQEEPGTEELWGICADEGSAVLGATPVPAPGAHPATHPHLHQKLPNPSAPRSFHTPDRSQCLNSAASSGSDTLPAAAAAVEAAGRVLRWR